MGDSRFLQGKQSDQEKSNLGRHNRDVSCKLLKAPDLARWRNTLAEVRLQEGEPLENALRRFKRKVQAEDIIKDVKRHSYYLKPGERKRVKQALARKRAKKKSRRDRDSRSDRD